MLENETCGCSYCKFLENEKNIEKSAVKTSSAGFVTKDSGERQEFSTGMVRDTENNKVLYDLVFDGPMLKRWAELLTRGAKKYSPKNWLKACKQEELDRARSSAARHFFQYMNGDTDEDHAAASIFNINLAEYIKEKLKTKLPDIRQG